MDLQMPTGFSQVNSSSLFQQNQGNFSAQNMTGGPEQFQALSNRRNAVSNTVNSDRQQQANTIETAAREIQNANGGNTRAAETRLFTALEEYTGRAPGSTTNQQKQAVLDFIRNSGNTNTTSTSSNDQLQSHSNFRLESLNQSQNGMAPGLFQQQQVQPQGSIVDQRGAEEILEEIQELLQKLTASQGENGQDSPEAQVILQQLTELTQELQESRASGGGENNTSPSNLQRTDQGQSVLGNNSIHSISQTHTPNNFVQQVVDVYDNAAPNAQNGINPALRPETAS